MGLAPHVLQAFWSINRGPACSRKRPRDFDRTDDVALTADTRKGAAVGTDCTLWRVAPACAGRRPLPCGLNTAASRAILLSDAKRIGWTAFLTPTCRYHNAFSISPTGNANGGTTAMYCMASSPLAWRKQRGWPACPGITPRWAGYHPHTHSITMLRTTHLHSRRENSGKPDSFRVFADSSPRGRGKLLDRRVGLALQRLIPARAGKHFSGYLVG